MCGVTGLMAPDYTGDFSRLATTAERMATAISHRGPDDRGLWVEAEAGIALAHQRLSILDLTTAGHQPMHSATGRYVIAFNGEIYNHGDLRCRLTGHAWRGHSDTETLLASIEAWGVDAALRDANGMFAFVLWDRLQRKLTLARDRIGEKPLYYGWCGNTFVFASELKALRVFPGWHGEVDREALAAYMRYGYVPAPYSIYRGVCKLAPGTFLTVPSGMSPGTWPQPQAYWSASDIAGREVLHGLSDTDAIAGLEGRLARAIGRQMIADVPLGAFLSGGIDSSAIVALMQAQSARPVRTFTVGFAEKDYNEASHAKSVAKHLGTDHSELYVSPRDAQSVVPRLADIYDEPFADSSAIPTLLIAELARANVTVALSGDGGDELFGGYNRYFWGRAIWRKIGHLPVALRRGVGLAITALPPATWDRLGRALPRCLRQPTFGDRMHKFAAVIDVVSPDELYQRLVSQQRETTSLVIGAGEPRIWAENEAAHFSRSDFTERMMFHDVVGYLTDDILVKVDRAAMAVSLETRVPMLDRELVEFAWRLPLRMKMRDGHGKWLLRQVLYRHVPRELIERPKQGFSIPLDSWLRGALRDWAEALLDETRLKRENFLRPELIRRKWHEHLSGRRNWQHWLWNVLMFQAWYEKISRKTESPRVS